MKSHCVIVVLTLAAAVRCTGDGTTSNATEEPTTTGSTTGGATTEDPTTTVPTTGTPGGVPCAMLADCTPSPTCRQAIACTAGECVFADLPEGTALPQQVAGDCAEEVCDGAGGTKLVAADDPPDDGIVCTLDVCDGLVPKHMEGMAPCYGGDPGTAGVGACKPGVQSCDESGVPQGPCVGEVVPADEQCDAELADEDCDGEVNESGAACLCEPGAAQECYSGPDGTASVGLCAVGQQTCAASGLEFEACAGEVVPVEEDCDAGMLDEDCDGEVNESGATCTCGDGFLSVGEECDDGNLQDGDGCSASCKLPAQAVRVATGYDHTCAVLANHRVKCWGLGTLGTLGHGDFKTCGDEPGEMSDALPYTDLGAGVEAVDVTAGEGHTCALLVGGKLKCWGVNAYGKLGLGDKNDRGFTESQMGDNLPYVDLGAGKIATAVTAGKEHTCALLDGGDVKCWGRGGFGAIGYEDQLDRGDEPGEMGDTLAAVKLGTGRTAVAIDAGAYHTCAVLDDGSLKCWGYGYRGRLGLESEKDYGTGPGQMGDALPVVKLGAGNTAVAVSAGADHTCALLNGGRIKCWGTPDSGGLGNENISMYGAFLDTMGDNLPVVKLGEGKTALEVKAGRRRTCALLTGGEVKCWGISYLGVNVGGGGTGDNIGEMGDNLPIVDLGAGQVATAIAADCGGELDYNYRTCAVLASGALKCWGNNKSGELGQGDTMPRGDGADTMGDKLLPIAL